MCDILKQQHLVLADNVNKISDRGAQTDFRESEKIERLKAEIASLKSEVKQYKQKAATKSGFLECIKQSEDSIQFYTGLTKEDLNCLWNFLKEEAEHLRIVGTKNQMSGNIKFTLEEQFYIFLVRLRQNTLLADFEYRFNLKPQDLVSKVFKVSVFANFLLTRC